MMTQAEREERRRSTGLAERARNRGAAALRRMDEARDNRDGLLARGLGWFSVGLGLAELAAPQEVARVLGVREDRDNCAVLRACGLRELGSGVGILTTPEPQSLLWGRVAGDVMDLVLLGMAARAPDSSRERLALAASAVVGVTVLDMLGAQGRSLHNGGEPELQRRGRLTAWEGAIPQARRAPGVHVKEAITVRRPPEEVYRFWHRFQELPKFMSHLESVEVLDARRSHWRAKAPAGSRVEWDAEITEDVSGEVIAWRSLPGADVESSGSVRFRAAPGDRGSEVSVELSYRPPGGVLGAAFAKLFGEAPEQQIKSDLRRFKQVLETGEVLHSDASIRSGAHPARPPADKVVRESPLAAPKQRKVSQP